MTTYYPPNWSYGTGASHGDSEYYWDTDDDEVHARHYCAEKGHVWADTGMKWTYCKECDAEGMWDMKYGYQLSDRKRHQSG